MEEQDSDIVIGQCDNCGKIDDAGRKAAEATEYRCYWCWSGTMIEISSSDPQGE